MSYKLFNISKFSSIKHFSDLKKIGKIDSLVTWSKLYINIILIHARFYH